MQKKYQKLTYFILSAFFAVFIFVGALLKIPVATTHITLQTLFVLLSGALLGPKYGTLAVILYLALGLLGIPVFTKGGGPAYILEPSFGYLVGFVPCAFCFGYLAKRCSRFGVLFFSAIVSLLPVYLFGTMYFYLVSRFYLGSSFSLSSLLVLGVVMFLPVDILSCLLCAWITKIIRPSISRYL